MVARLVLVFVQVCWDDTVGRVPSNITHLLLVPVTPAALRGQWRLSLNVCVGEPCSVLIFLRL